MAFSPSKIEIEGSRPCVVLQRNGASREVSMRTSEAIASMLTENTGRHMLDSGDYYGRHWQRNQGRAFESEPATILSFRHGEISVTHNVFHFLKEKLSYSEEGNRALHVLDRYLRLQNWSAGEHAARGYNVDTHEFIPAKNGEGASVYTLREEFPEFFRAWKARKDGEHASVSYDSKDGVVADSPYEIGAFGGAGNPVTTNSYNEENLLSQDILFTYFTLEHEEYVVLQIHGGCDARGGYTMPQVFTCSEEAGIFDYARAGIGCTGEGPFTAVDTGQVDLPGIPKPPETDWRDHNWTTDNGCNWYDNGCCGGSHVNLEDIGGKSGEGFVCIDPVAWEEAVKNGAEPDELGIVEGDERWSKNLAKTWIKGRVCFTHNEIEVDGAKIEAGTGLCPHCGGILTAGMY